VRTIMRHSLPRISTAATLCIAAFAATFLAGCPSANQLLYTNKDMQSIQRDTVLPSGQIKTEIQTPPENAAPGVIKLAPIESLNLQPVTLQVEPGITSSPFTEPKTLNVPPGFSASLYAWDLGQPRDLVLRDDGTLFYSNIDAGEIVAIAPDKTKTVIARDLRSPHGMEWHNGALYYTDETHVYRFDFDSPTAVTGKSTMISDKVPIGGFNYTRTIRWSPADKRFYISVGSTTNKNIEDDTEHGAVLKMDEKGGLPTVSMRGLRDAVGLDIHPETGELWGVDAGTQLLAEQLPPTEINILKVGKHYGWPYYYSQNFRDPYYTGPDTTEYPVNAKKPAVTPIIELQAHLEPKDLQFYPYSAFGADWKNSMLITAHGESSLNQGFKVIRVRANADGSNARVADVVTGFSTPDGGTWGTPVAIAFSRDGKSIFISDDRAGAIYKIFKP
jgi:glucose/arabinose dehydrogenase